MIEIPESYTIAKQLNETIKGKIISIVKANQSPHSFAWYFGEPQKYGELLEGKTIGDSFARSGMIEIQAEDCRLVFSDGACIRYHNDLTAIPAKHQLYVEFDDGTALVCKVQMYGGIFAFHEGENDNPYYITAKSSPNPLTDEFTPEYFESLQNEKTKRLSAKAFLATEQRIPGLGNGVLQDILFLSGIHPKRKMNTLSEEEYGKMYATITNTLRTMAKEGGRDTENDLFGNSGGYQTLLSKKTLWTPCIVCGYELRKANYMGGTIYYCEHCQKEAGEL